MHYHFGPVTVLLGLLVLREHEAICSVWKITTIPIGKREKVDAPLLHGHVVEHVIKLYAQHLDRMEPVTLSGTEW